MRADTTEAETMEKRDFYKMMLKDPQVIEQRFKQL